MTQQNNNVWFITGASRGFGQVWTEAALERGDNRGCLFQAAAMFNQLDFGNKLINKYGKTK